MFCGFSADMWSVGCILAELIRHKETAEFGEREVQERIEKGQYDWVENFGDEYFQNYGQPNSPAVRENFTGKLRALFGNLISLRILAENARDLLSRLLTVNPDARIGALDATKHRYLKSWRRADEVDLEPTWSGGMQLNANKRLLFGEFASVVLGLKSVV